MNIKKCDICNKTENKNSKFGYVRPPDFSPHDICADCMQKHSAPLLEKLEAAKDKKLADQ